MNQSNFPSVLFRTPASGLRRSLLITACFASIFAVVAGAPLKAFAAKPESPGAKGQAIADAARNGNPPGRGIGNDGIRDEEEAEDEDEDEEEDEDEDKDDDGGTGRGHTVFLTGFDGTTTSHLRFANFGNSAGRPTVILHDSQTGTEIGSWTGPEIPSHGAHEISLADIAAAAVPEVDPLDPLITLEIRAAFNGHVQHLGHHGGTGQTTNLTSCARLEVPRRALGYVVGPGRTDLTGGIELLNTGNTAATATLRLFDAETGAALGAWTSPSLPPHAALSTSTTALVAGVTPAIAPLPEAVTVTLDTPAQAIALAYLEGTTAGAISDLTAGCVLKGSEDADDDDEEEEDEEDAE